MMANYVRYYGLAVAGHTYLLFPVLADVTALLLSLICQDLL